MSLKFLIFFNNSRRIAIRDKGILGYLEWLGGGGCYFLWMIDLMAAMWLWFVPQQPPVMTRFNSS